MTGPAEGKILLGKAEVQLLTNHGKIELNGAEVYIHIKGYSLARVTHLDVEHTILDKIIPPKRGKFLKIIGIENGFRIQLNKGIDLKIEDKNIVVYSIKVLHPYLKDVLAKNEEIVTWVGGKFGGIYVGFRKKQIAKLEEIARKNYNFNV